MRNIPLPPAQLPRVDPIARALAKQERYLNEWVFYLPYMISVAAYFRLIASEARVIVPALAPLCVLANVGMLALLRQRVAVNTRVVGVMLAWFIVSMLSLLWGSADSYYSIRKIALPLMCMLPGVFRFNITRSGVLVFAIILAIISVIFTTQSADTFNEGFISTDSPYESIMGVAFGILTVWLVGSSALVGSGVAYAACILFFKRNAILAAAVASAVGVLLRQILGLPAALRYIKIAIAILFILSPIVAFYLVDIYDWIADNSGFVINGDELSSGRNLIYLVITGQIFHSGIIDFIFGHGAGAVEQLVSTTSLIAVNLGLAHNEYLSMIYDFGIFGFVIIAIMIFRCIDTMASALVVLFVSISMSGENFFLITFSCLMVFFLLSARLVQIPNRRLALG